ncbi:MAG: hypothetical protein JNK75_03050 [Betaproteobacteria bacterium]|nr:hypothetical protein [Betaproteobacteria bacterium]
MHDRLRSAVGPTLVLLWVACFSTPSSAVTQDWLPPHVADGMAKQFLERMIQTDPGRMKDPERAMTASRHLVETFRREIDRWGPEGVLRRAPPLTKVKLPAAKQRDLDAMARYQVCNVVLMLQFENGADPHAKQIGAMGLTGVTMLIAALRGRFLGSGGKDARIEQFLTNAEMERVTERLQRDQALLDNAQSDCGKVVGELLATL